MKFNIQHSHTFSIFLLIGGFCYAVNLAILYLLTEYINFHYLASATIAFILTTCIGYILNRTLTFNQRKTPFLLGMLKYNTVMISSYFFVIISMFILVDLLNIYYIFSNLIIAIASTIYNFLFHDKWTFKYSRNCLK